MRKRIEIRIGAHVSLNAPFRVIVLFVRCDLRKIEHEFIDFMQIEGTWRIRHLHELMLDNGYDG